jgi:hypothetical protein
MTEASKLLRKAVSTEFNRVLKGELRDAINNNAAHLFDSDAAKDRARAHVVGAVEAILDNPNVDE